MAIICFLTREKGIVRFDNTQRRREWEDGAERFEDADFEDWSEAKECWQLLEAGKGKK